MAYLIITMLVMIAAALIYDDIKADSDKQANMKLKRDIVILKKKQDVLLKEKVVVDALMSAVANSVAYCPTNDVIIVTEDLIYLGDV